METGQYIKDGDVTWIITDVRDGNQVGHIRLEYELLDGYVKANGATVKASDYPRLTAWRENQSDAVKSLFTYDESADTLTLPDLRGRFLEGGDSVAFKAAGLPNITGSFSINQNMVGGGAGALYVMPGSGYTHASPPISAVGAVGFNASKSNAIYGASNTVQPPAITLIPQIKY